MLKNKIRKRILKIRKIKNLKNVQIKFNKIINIIKKINVKGKIVGCYYPVNFEVDTKDLMTKLQQKGFKISLPVISSKFDMNFYFWNLNDPLYVNKYGIPEPISDKAICPNILLVPLVAFDKSFNRIGYGGGFYDRYIKKIKKNKKIITIGLAYSFQRIKEVPINDFDIKLDFVVTN